MSAPLQLTGKVFGRLTVLERVGVSKNKHALWSCICECGNNSIVFGSNLVREHTISCGCVNDEAITKHGHWGDITYQSWKGMIQRCTNPNAGVYHHYGGRGITVCVEWLNSFEQFFEDMGKRPDKKLSIERVDNNKGYNKENCRWATRSEQMLNRRRIL